MTAGSVRLTTSGRSAVRGSDFFDIDFSWL
jgi:hypothetical protein